MHFGIFTAVHGFFVIFVFILILGVPAVALAEGLLFVAASFLSHYTQFEEDFIRREEYLRVSPARQMWSPYPRVFAMHLTVLIGGWAALNSGNPASASVLLVVFKTLADVASHYLARKIVFVQAKH
jgi:hypothetical protein